MTLTERLFRIALPLAGILWLSAVPAVADPPCDARLKPLRGSDRAYKPRGDRCEGLFESKVSIPRLELVSLTVGKLRYPWREDAELRVSAPGATGTEVRIRAVAVPLDTYYQMDAVLAGRETMRWPLGDVLYPEELHDRRIGIVGWIDGDRSPVYVPLVVAPGADSEPTSPPGAVAVLRASIDILNVDWRVSSVQGGRCSSSGAWSSLRKPELRAGKPLHLIPPPVSAPEICVEVRGKEVDSDTGSVWMEFRLRTPPPSEG